MFIIIPIIITGILSYSVITNFKFVHEVQSMYTPLDAAWKKEDNIFRENWANSDSKFYPGLQSLFKGNNKTY